MALAHRGESGEWSGRVGFEYATPNMALSTGMKLNLEDVEDATNNYEKDGDSNHHESASIGSNSA